MRIACRILIAILFFPASINAQTINTIVGNGNPGYSGDNGLAINAELNTPTNVKFDHRGYMYIADWHNNVIRRVSPDGIITTVAGNGYGAGSGGIGGYSGDNGPATDAELFGPVDLVFDDSDNMYFTDNGNAVIRKVNNAGIITTIAGTGTFGYNGDGIPAITAELNYPVGLIFDNFGNLYFSDEGNSRVRKISTDGIITTFAGNGISGYGGDLGPATAANLRQPLILGKNSSGDIYIPDWQDHRVRKVNSAGIISTVAGTGMFGDDGDGGPATAAKINGCETVLFDDSSNFVISNNISCSIRKVSTSGVITTIVGNDTACGFGGDGGLAINARINIEAICSAIDPEGNLYIADSKNNRIRRVTYTPTFTYTAVNNVNNALPHVKIFPNPANTDIHIAATEELKSVIIENTLGQVVYNSSCNSKDVVINIERLPQGIYFARINGSEVKRFVKE